MINRLMAQLVDELRMNDVPDPLVQELTLAAVWDDLCRLAGETPPAAVRVLFDGDVPLWDTAALTQVPHAGGAPCLSV